MAVLTNTFPNDLNLHILSLENNIRDVYNYISMLVALKTTSKYLLNVVRHLTQDLVKLDEQIVGWILNKAIYDDNIGVYILASQNNMFKQAIVAHFFEAPRQPRDLFFMNESYKCWRYSQRKLPYKSVVMEYIRGMYRFFRIASLERLLNEHIDLFTQLMYTQTDYNILKLIINETVKVKGFQSNHKVLQILPAN